MQRRAHDYSSEGTVPSLHFAARGKEIIEI